MSDIDIMTAMDNIDLSKVETSFPILDSGIVTVQITKCEYSRDEKKGADAKPFCLVEMQLTTPWRTTPHNGPSKPINPGDRGSKFTERIYVGQYEDKKTGELKWYGVDTLAKLRAAAFGPAAPGVKFNPAEMLGQTISVRLKFEAEPKGKDGTVYGPRTSVSDYLAKKL